MTKGTKTTKTAAKAKTKAAPKTTSEKAETIGSFTKTCILAGMAVKDVAAAIKDRFPDCGPQLNSIYFYRSKLHKSGQLKKA